MGNELVVEALEGLSANVDRLFRLIEIQAAQIRRLECLQDLSKPPEDWNITIERLIGIAEIEGISMHMAREYLIRNFGVNPNDQDK